MPRRRGGQLEPIFTTDDDEYDHNGPVFSFLRDWAWQIHKEKNTMPECPVCTETECLSCKRCSLLLRCGHWVCAEAWMKISHKKRECPVCRR